MLSLPKPLPVYIGYDPREHDAYMVAKHSIERRASAPVLITPIYLPQTNPILHRPIELRNGRMYCPISEAPMATEFAISRFCVPFMQKEGWAVFMDCDMLCIVDIAELFALADDRYAVMVVKHKHENGGDVKMDNQVQTYYNRKNWSSVILWNLSHPSHSRFQLRDLNSLPGRDMHGFFWLDDHEIGELPMEWNYLVGINSGAASILHYTLGTPNMPSYENCDFADLWFNELEDLRSGNINPSI